MLELAGSSTVLTNFSFTDVLVCSNLQFYLKLKFNNQSQHIWFHVEVAWRTELYDH